MTTVFVYEDVTAHGAGGGPGPPPAPSLLAEGRAMLEAMAADFAAVPGVQVQRPADGGFDGTCGTNGTVGQGVLDLAATANYSLVIGPECGGRLEHLCREVVRVGGRLLGPSPDAIRMTADKLALAHHWERHGIPVPSTWELGHEPTNTTVVVKPRDGAGSQGMSLLWRQDSDPAGAAQDPSPASTNTGPMIAQQYVPGLAASVAFLIGPSRIVPLVPCLQLLSTDGKFQYLGGRLPIDPDLADRAVRVASAAVRSVPGLLGYVGVDVVLGNDGRDWAIEINPRLTTSYVGLRALAQFNIAEVMLAIIRDQPAPEMSWHDPWLEFTPDGRVFDVAPTPSGAAST